MALTGSSSPSFPPAQAPDDWVDRFLLAGPDDQECLRFEAPVDRAALRALVAEQAGRLTAAGLTRGGTAALRLAPSLGYTAALLACWQLGAQAVLLDHRLTDHEVALAVERLAPQVLVESAHGPAAAMRGFAETDPVPVALPGGRPAATGHALVQLSSGSTGPAKVIARTAADLLRELDCYARLEAFPKAGERVVLLSSMVHVLGLVGGLLNSLHARVPLTVPARTTTAGVLAAIGADDRPTTVIGVPFHAELLAGAADPPPLPQLRRMIVAGELVRPGVPAAFTARYGVPLGTMYGMTETGVIATDLTGRNHPAVEPVHGMELSVAGGELHIAREESPYLGPTDPTRWSDGLLHTRDAALIEAGTGLVTVLGRRDSQVSIGGLKVDLNEVEHTLAALPEVREAVVVFADGAIEAYLATGNAATAGVTDRADAVREALARELAAFKRPRRLTFLPALPRTATGKLVRDAAALRAATP
ncbi:class I adenylate-forming enzyme family protein [Kitasatospora sp. NPDC057198]|uniref:class I adenylate-forming enzyme family protein n=1 Tax=Kitasatospora sp. NPDC057198 TaxID=3346046 RepID=UPI00363F7974